MFERLQEKNCRIFCSLLKRTYQAKRPSLEFLGKISLLPFPDLYRRNGDNIFHHEPEMHALLFKYDLKVLVV